MAIEWRTIGELTDKNVLGTNGLSFKGPRRKSRAILINEDGQYAVMYEMKSDLHTLPGGAIEAGEDEITALIREIFEETGCTCDSIEPLGIVFENRFHTDSTHLSYFFVVHTKTRQPVSHLTDEEAELETCLKWCTLEEVLHLIKDIDHDSKHKKFLQARDVAAFEEYIHSASGAHPRRI